MTSIKKLLIEELYNEDQQNQMRGPDYIHINHRPFHIYLHYKCEAEKVLRVINKVLIRRKKNG